jgi:hypothetical protein
MTTTDAAGSAAAEESKSSDTGRFGLPYSKIDHSIEGHKRPTWHLLNPLF